MDSARLNALFDAHATELAPALLGCELTVLTEGGSVRVRLTEVEAYGDQGEDPGAHSYNGKTARNAALFGPPRHTYVYLNYGIHRCLNFACADEGTAGGVLLRAGEVLAGRELAIERRGGRDTGAKLLSGPGRLGQGLGITLPMDALPVHLRNSAASADPARFTLTPPAEPVNPEQIRSGARVGVSGAGGSIGYPWRYWLDADPTVSAYRPGRNVPAEVSP
ncbi:DNA-3-methyladenine glycosylase [Nesterenkonia sp. LB17]|uniref:DNA-3-methyladenine glycosylase n=1 Tax=unclassified Nesterenkonia TaxID=2629769 RepID=UPI001F4D0097|nr:MULTISPECIES: DNA-3-methyladenine glycosylase [unclassified Nesterenkonia]MCH8561489.1 DNA-3-methyladenine glycosylase [Nesterenkonia sp. DZ6]MCH8563934.1 DNA-3-methyladenine glycosylase [Nesterenkonia sp. YGD6]MCH8566532.1 DNA-3-methyladenine glycosylase [Nesterenkonia sp. LB17]MCH8571906.1 DNA-3-methyladenine glycosylase [Nesterenkonia sp. AY15]